MNQEQMRTHCLQFGAAYYQLLADTSATQHDPDEHNLCSAVVEHPQFGTMETIYSYSNPSALRARRFADYHLVEGEVANKLIDRGGMQDLHTEVRLINYLYDRDLLGTNTVVSFFSSRSVCGTCRPAIYETMRLLQGRCAFMAYEFKVEVFGSITGNVYPILQDVAGPQAAIRWDD